MLICHLTLIIYMQQQIYIEEEQQLQDLNNIINPVILKSNIEEHIQENITENYQDDFDLISQVQNSIPPSQPEIEEEYHEDYSYYDIYLKEQYNQMNSQQLEKECKQLSQKIQYIQNQCQIAEQNRDQDDNYEQLIETIKNNNQILNNFQQQKRNYLQNMLGHSNFCSELLLHEDEYAQQKLLQQTDRLKSLINLEQLQINRIKRQVKKNEQLLPEIEAKQQQLFRKYKQIKKQIEQKNNKFSQNHIKQQELTQKLSTLKCKLTSIESDVQQNYLRVSIKGIKDLENIYKRLVKAKENEGKKNGFLLHQYENNSLNIGRNIVQLNLQNEEINCKIDKIETKNLKIEQQSQLLLQKYLKKKEKLQIIQENQNKRITQRQVIPQTKVINNLHSDRTNQRYSTTPKRKNHSVTNQSSTITNLKQFKLKLPISNIKSSQKKLEEPKKMQISFDLLSQGNSIMPNIQKQPKNIKQNEKLTIAQRIQKIENLQKQDRIFSSKLYEKMDQLRQQTKLQFNKSLNKLQNKTQQLKDIIKIKQTSKTQNLKKQNSISSNYNSSLIFDTQGHQKEGSNKLKSYESSKIQSENQLPSYRKAYIINKKMSNSRKDEPLIDLKHDSTQEIKQNDKTFDMTYNQSMIQGQRDLNNSYMSMISSNYKFIKKRTIYREKKISQDYMRILQQRGRKILQLDNENEQ